MDDSDVARALISFIEFPAIATGHHLEIDQSDQIGCSIGKDLVERNQSSGICQVAGCLETSFTGHKFCPTHMGNRHCQADGCTKYAQGRTVYCLRHGGGNRCLFMGCSRAARDNAFCVAHGGGKRCKYDTCQKLAIGQTDFCVGHGGGRKCLMNGCTKCAQATTPYCIQHGGGKRCLFEGCTKMARGSTQFCASHGGGKRCAAVGCFRPVLAKQSYCSSHPNGMTEAFSSSRAQVGIADSDCESNIDKRRDVVSFAFSELSRAPRTGYDEVTTNRVSARNFGYVEWVQDPVSYEPTGNSIATPTSDSNKGTENSTILASSSNFLPVVSLSASEAREDIEKCMAALDLTGSLSDNFVPATEDFIPILPSRAHKLITGPFQLEDDDMAAAAALASTRDMSTDERLPPLYSTSDSLEPYGTASDSYANRVLKRKWLEMEIDLLASLSEIQATEVDNGESNSAIPTTLSAPLMTRSRGVNRQHLNGHNQSSSSTAINLVDSNAQGASSENSGHHMQRPHSTHSLLGHPPAANSAYDALLDAFFREDEAEVLAMYPLLQATEIAYLNELMSI